MLPRFEMPMASVYGGCVADCECRDGRRRGAQVRPAVAARRVRLARQLDPRVPAGDPADPSPVHGVFPPGLGEGLRGGGYDEVSRSLPRTSREEGA